VTQALVFSVASRVRQFLLLLPIFALSGCATVCATLIGGLIGDLVHSLPSHSSDIRVRNASVVTLRNVTIGAVNYGDLAAGETSDYKMWGPAYRHCKVQLEVDASKLLHPSELHFGERPLGPGKFTFVLEVEAPTPKSDFSVTVLKD
jgi:hypothetical protein